MVKKRKYIKIIASFVVVTLVLALLKFARIDPVGFIKCTLTHGSYEKPIQPLGAPIGNSYCVYTYSDGGKACKSSTECQGDCLVTKETQLKPKGLSSEYVGGYGKCETSNRFTPCYPGTIENPFSWCI